MSVLVSSAVLFTLTAALPEQKSNAAAEVIIDINKEYQTIRGFGGIDHPEWTGSSLTDSQKKTAFGNGDNELGLTILRVFVNPDKNQWYKALPTAQYATKMGDVTILRHLGNHLQISQNLEEVMVNSTFQNQIMLLMHSTLMILVLI